MNTHPAFVRLLPVIFVCLSLVGCGDAPKTAVVEQPVVSAEEKAAADEAYNKSMDN